MQYRHEHHDPHDHEHQGQHGEGRGPEREERRGSRGGRRSRGPRPGDGFERAFGMTEATGPDSPMGNRGRFGPGGPFGPRPGFGPSGRGSRGPRGPRPGFGPGGPFDPFESDMPMGRRGAHRGRRGGRPGGPRGTGRARRGDVRLALIGLLAEAPMNGYQLIKELQERTGGRWRPSPGAVYPALAQLQDEGLIEPADGDGKVFQLTDTGRAETERAGERAHPWESFTAEEDGDSEPAPTTEVWEALGKLSVAARAATTSGDTAVRHAVAELLDETRRGVYRLLAEDSGPVQPPEDQG